MIGLGYEGLTVDEFCAQVAELEVAMVVDIRLNALSRKPGFSKNGLRTALAEIGVDYLHLPALGNTPDNRSGFARPESEESDEARRRYAAVFATPSGHAAIEMLAELSCSQHLAVMCFERDQRQCHRQMVIDRLVARFQACG